MTTKRPAQEVEKLGHGKYCPGTKVSMHAHKNNSEVSSTHFLFFSRCAEKLQESHTDPEVFNTTFEQTRVYLETMNRSPLNL